MTLLLWIIAAILVIAGFAGLVLPALPGMVLIFCGLVVAAWAEHFAYVGSRTIAVLALLVFFALLIDLLAGVLGAKKFGAGRYALIGAAIGAFCGLFFGIPGIVAGPFFGAFFGELVARKDIKDAGIAAIGTWIGLLAGSALKIAIAFIMLALFILVRFL
ncbi:MAG: DUF456 family protein [Chlorobiaceae bacterium]